MKFVKSALALGLISVSTMASADSWLYAGGMVGQSSFEDDKTSTFGLHVGTGILPIIGIEGGYWTHGTFEYNQGDEAKLDSYYLAIKPSIDVGPVQIYGRVGAHSYELNGKNGTANDDGFDLMYGVGAEYYIVSIVSVGLGYQKFQFDKGDVDSFTLNATFHFL